VSSRSYSSIRLGPLGRLRELIALYRIKRRDVPGQVAVVAARLQQADREVVDLLGAPLEGGDVLVIGPGQQLSEMIYWSQHRNRVVGIDLDPYPSDPSPVDYLRMLRNDGLIRTAKTLGRRLTGIDRAYRRELRRQIDHHGQGRTTVRSMDAGRTTFDDASFDLAYSRSVFEHLRDPGAAIEEIGRVLRPGGVAHIELHLYTSDSGVHDARIFAGDREELPYWSHLRPAHAERVRPNSYLNELRLHEWEALFTERWPDVTLERRPTADRKAIDTLPSLRDDGELTEYDDDELLTVAIVAKWKRGDDPA
jgi:SAM-dependent methyltransferase